MTGLELNQIESYRDRGEWTVAHWHAAFAHWDALVATVYAIKMANEAAQRAGYEWDRYHG